jgi:hypothetical protein
MSQASKAETPPDRPAVSFGRYYYQHDCGIPYERNDHWLAEFRTIARALIRRFQPATALDAGCAIGLLVETLRDEGVDARGIDISEFAVSQAPEPIRPYLTQGSLVEPIEGRYDVVTCIEVVEHMEAADAPRAIENLCAVTDRILFSSSPNDYSEPTHLSVRPPEYWAGLFAEHGFIRDTSFDASFITPWAVVFERVRTEPAEIVRRYETIYWRAVDQVDQVRSQILALQNRLEDLTELGGGAALDALLDREREGVEKRQYVENLERELLAAREQILSMRDEIVGLEGRLAVSEGNAEFHHEESLRYENFIKEYEAILASTSWRAIRRGMRPYDWVRRQFEDDADPS